jgi:NADH-quinone oxidoreductase subunit N
MDQLNIAAAAPEVFLLAAACALLVIDLFISDARRNITYALALLILAGAAAICAFFLANDLVQYAFGGMYVTDPMASLLKLCACIGVALMLVYAQGYARDRGIWKGELFTLALFVLLGVFVMISANNLIVVYLGLELQALAMYALVALRRDDARATEAAMKYFVLGALASGFLLYGMSMLYGATGTLDINEMARNILAGKTAGKAALVLGTVFIVAGLAFKLGVVPFHMWVPDVYHGAPTPVAAFIGSVPKLAAFAIAFRLLVEGLLPLAADWQQMLVVLAVGSLAIGNLTAIAQTNLKRMLAYSSISHMGFLLLGFLAGNAFGFAAAMFYVAVYVLMNLGTFGMILMLARSGFEADQLDDYRGLARRAPWQAFIMLLLMFSMAGLPPMVGFYAKLTVLAAVVDIGLVWLAVFAVMMSLVGAFYYLRIVKLMYFDEPVDTAPVTATADARVLMSVNGLAVLALGLMPQPLMAWCLLAIQRSI